MSAPYRPGQQWPDNRPQRPERPPPIQFRQEEPPPAPGKALQWTMRGLGLVVVAAVSGLVWYYINNDSSAPATNTGGPTATQEPSGVYQFKPYKDMPKPDDVTNCAEHAYDDTRTFLREHKCDHLARQLFVTTVDGRTIYTSVSVVTMRSDAEAQQLRDITDTDGRGNVNDIVRDRLVKIDGMNSLGRADGYKSKQGGKEVTIVEADFDPKDAADKKDDEKILDKVCIEALLLADQVNQGAGAH